jgi:hypothetical protein
LREPVSVSVQQGQAFSAQAVAVPVPPEEVAVAQEVAKVQREVLPQSAVAVAVQKMAQPLVVER